MDANSRKTGLTRLPLWTAVFVALICVVILAVTGVREWSARQSDLAAAEASMGNLARSLVQHVETRAGPITTSAARRADAPSAGV
jgi:membrane protein YdbS with pleckstrin-like domain